jgi:hypothetical protein
VPRRRPEGHGEAGPVAPECWQNPRGGGRRGACIATRYKFSVKFCFCTRIVKIELCSSSWFGYIHWWERNDKSQEL